MKLRAMFTILLLLMLGCGTSNKVKSEEKHSEKKALTKDDLAWRPVKIVGHLI